ncbi:MAG: hypothetical protein ACREE2_06530 [Stellaceae bacterium]
MRFLGHHPPGSITLMRRLGIAVLVVLWCCAGIAPAHALDVFAGHQVTTQFATAAGQPMANAEVRVFAPGNLKTPVETGRTDAQGKFVFGADRDGMWTAEARTPSEVARVMIRVGSDAPQQQSRVSPYILIAGLVLLVALAWWYRLVRRRARRQP